MDIGILIEEGFEDYLEASWLEDVVARVLAVQGVSSATELSLVIVGQEKIHRLNLGYLGKDEPTDVLAFAMLPRRTVEGEALFATPPDGITHLGEVIISYPQAVIQAEEQQHSVKREVAFLAIHGVLHLLGYDHDEAEPEKEMRTREQEILNKIEGVLG